MWAALGDIAQEQGRTVHDIAREIEAEHSQTNLSAAIRVYIVEFYRNRLGKLHC
jgi:predicted DNA-binding ribbon-helix-helix protein